MIDRITLFLINNKIVVFTVILFLIVFGLIVSPFESNLPVLPKASISIDAIPDLGENQQIVYTEWAGQSPREIEDQVTYPLTTNLLGIPGVKSVRGNSMFGFSTVSIIFEDNIDFYWSRTRILEKLNSLPSNLLPQGIKPKLGPDATTLGQVFWYTLEGRDPDGNVTGGWDLQELRSIQDFYVKNALASTKGVAEVASIGGFVKEYQVDVDPALLQQYKISLQEVIEAVKASNKEIGAQTLEINRAEYFVRGLGYVRSLEDLKNTTITSNSFSPITIGDIAKVYLGPAERRGILDKGGAEVVGGVITAQFGANPMEVLQELKSNIEVVGGGLPKKNLKDGRLSQLTIVPFYDRSELIEESLDTLGDALFFEIIIAVLVVLVLLRNLKISILISGLLPLAVLSVFIAMKLFSVDANIVALSGIAIAIGTMVDMGIILVENIVRHQEEFPHYKVTTNVIKASGEVSGAIITAGLTTIISFIPVFVLTGAEGKLFTPLAFTKTVALFSSIAITLFALPAITAVVLKRQQNSFLERSTEVLVILIGLVFCLFGHYTAVLLIIIGGLFLMAAFGKIAQANAKWYSLILVILYALLLLTMHWRPLGYQINLFSNGLFILFIVALILVPLQYFLTKYETMLEWILANKLKSILPPLILLLLGFIIAISAQKEFMPKLDEGEFLLMPTSLPQSGITETSQVLKKLDIAVASIPEVEYVVGKAGRVESALDPAPLSMYENLISYKPEFILDNNRNPVRFKVDEEGKFIKKNGQKIISGQRVRPNELVVDKRNGSYYRNWRPHITKVEDIWEEISSISRLPGVTTAPKLQPIETRLVMLQTGMRSNLGIKVKGQDLVKVEEFALDLEKALKEMPGIFPESVFADRIIGKPYLLLDINREKLSRYGLGVVDVQQTIEVAVGGKIFSETIEGRERYNIRVRYPRELRGTPQDLNSILISVDEGVSIPISEFVTVRYEKGPQNIRSEDGFLISYVIFDKTKDISEVAIVDKAKEHLLNLIDEGTLEVPNGVSYEFSGVYENHVRSQKTLALVIPAVLMLIILLLYLQFRSLSISLMVFSGVAVAFAGGFVLLWLYGQPWFLNLNLGTINFREIFNIQAINLSVAVWVGFIALFGIATDDGVVMGTYLNQSFKEKNPKTIGEIREAVILAGKRRIRPCLITTATTILALLPVLSSTGRGSNIMVPMAVPVFGGMLMALITLFIVPLLYCWQKEILLSNNIEQG